jgi:radical SAM superfamily enzyme
MENYVAANRFCVHHHIEYSFLEALQQHGLIEISIIEEGPCLREETLPLLEKMVRLHYDLDINIEGIETVTHLLEQLQTLQEKITALQNRLSLYEHQ